MLLVYLAIAADIVEIFEAFRESKVTLKPFLTYVVLAVWSWSLLQFCVVLRGTHRGRKARIGSLFPGAGGNPKTTLTIFCPILTTYLPPVDIFTK